MAVYEFRGIQAATGKAVKGLIRGPANAYVGLMFGDDEYIYEADANVPLTIQRDVSRSDSPLTIAEDSVVIDTSELDLTEVPGTDTFDEPLYYVSPAPALATA